jgi:asparagine synthase (glutamine-hydrolysing)
MCGIAGFIDPSKKSDTATLNAIVTRMSEGMLTRGPDDGGAWADAERGVALGHRRLSILDLSPEGHQPMTSADDRYVIVFNGEIYNFKILHAELAAAGHKFRGHSDTEIMLAGFVQWGIEATLKRLVGMFAIALWDRREKTLTLTRDRLGEKPLYFGVHNGVLLFASQLKPIQAHPAFRGEVNRDAVALLMRHCYIPAPYSIYKNIHKLQPGTYLTISAANPAEALIKAPTEYWSARAAAEAGTAEPFSGTDAEATQKLDALLRESVAQQMVADVPLGAFLSGGIDSSTIVALMQAQSSRPVKTFTIGFHEQGYNEAEHAKAVAKHLGTDHTELYVTSDEAMNVIPNLPDLYDEPFSDSSQIPTFLVSRLARKHVTVSLSGDAGDELFCGYPRYEAGMDLWRKLGWMPRFARRGIGTLVSLTPTRVLDGALALQNPKLSKTVRTKSTRSKWKKVSEILSAPNGETLYLGLLSHWQQPEELVLQSKEPPTAVTDAGRWAKVPEFLQSMMFIDTISYLPDDILAKVDRAAMGVSLETRVPMLDHRLVEFAWQVPLHMKRRNGTSKWLLREVLYKYVPREMIERPKMGFGVPIDMWLRGKLRDWAEALLNENRLKREGYFNTAMVRQKWQEHLDGTADWHYWLWDVLMFQAWLERQKN